MRPVRFWSEPLLQRALFPRLNNTPHRTPLRNFFTSTPLASKGLPPWHSSIQRRLQLSRSPLFQRFRSLRFNSNKNAPPQRPDPTPHLGSPEPSLSFSQRLKRLSKEYGWTAVGVYFALSALDLPFFFLLVQYLGAERVGHYEHVVVEGVKDILRIPFPNLGRQKEEAIETGISVETAEATAREGEWTDELEAAEAQNEGAEASIWTQLTLAYVIHKSFIFVRVPLTAAVLPKVVKTLRKWGWEIGKRKPKT